MQINPMAAVLACTCVMMAGAGLAARSTAPAPPDPWTSEARPGAVAFRDEFLTLLTPPAAHRSDHAEPAEQRSAEPAAVPAADATTVRTVRVIRPSRSVRTAAVEIEFVDAQGRAQLRRYALEPATVGARSREAEAEPEDSAREAAGYPPRRSRRSNVRRYRGWW
jgi:hypothetical protein